MERKPLGTRVVMGDGLTRNSLAQLLGTPDVTPSEVENMTMAGDMLA